MKDSDLSRGRLDHRSGTLWLQTTYGVGKPQSTFPDTTGTRINGSVSHFDTSAKEGTSTISGRRRNVKRSAPSVSGTSTNSWYWFLKGRSFQPCAVTVVRCRILEALPIWPVLIRPAARALTNAQTVFAALPLVRVIFQILVLYV